MNKIVKERDKLIEDFERKLKKVGYELCRKYTKDKCDAGEGCIHLRTVKGIKLCWTK